MSKAGFKKLQDKHSQGSTLPSTIVNMLNSIIGTGSLTLSYGLQQTGLKIGTLFFLLSAFTTHQTFQYLAYVAEETNIYVYKDIAHHLFKKKWIGIMMSIIVIFYVCGSLAAYNVAISDNMFWFESKVYKYMLLVAIEAVLIGPIACCKSLDILKYNGYITLVTATYVSLVVVIYFFINKRTPLPPCSENCFQSSSLATLPLFLVSFCGHFSTSYIYKEMKDRTLSTFDIAIAGTALILILLNALNMYFGYFTFTENVNSDLLKTIAMYSSESHLLKSANIAQIILLIAHYPATAFGARKNLESLIFHQNTPKWGTILIVYLLMTVLTILTFFIDEIAQILDFTGSLAGSFVILIFPAAMCIIVNYNRQVKWYHQIIPGFCLIYGFIVLILGFIGSIIQWV